MTILYLLLVLAVPRASSAAADCPGILKVAATHSNRWQWTRESTNEMKNITYENHPWEWLYMAPLTILAAPGDVLAMPFRHSGIVLRGSISGSISEASGRPLSDFPWKSWPWKYQDHRGQKALRGLVRSYHRACTAQKPCGEEDTQTDQYEFGTTSSGSFVFAFEGFLVRDGYIEINFPAPLDRTIRVYREEDGRMTTKDPVSGAEICALELQASSALSSAK